MTETQGWIALASLFAISLGLMQILNLLHAIRRDLAKYFAPPPSNWSWPSEETLADASGVAEAVQRELERAKGRPNG